MYASVSQYRLFLNTLHGATGALLYNKTTVSTHSAHCPSCVMPVVSQFPLLRLPQNNLKDVLLNVGIRDQ